MALVLLSNKGSKLTVQEMDSNFEYVKNLTEITYNELTKLISSFDLVPGMFYLITDFRTCYTLPDYDIFGNAIKICDMIHIESEIEPIIVMATSNKTLSVDAFQPKYPNDKIRYEWNYGNTLSGNPAFGRITERIDEFDNRTDYDHRNIKFKRYRYYSYSKSNLQPGKVKIHSDGIVLGEETSFTELAPGDIIAIPGTKETFYKVISIKDDNKLKIRGSQITANEDWSEFYLCHIQDYLNHYPNNCDFQDDYKMFTTFPLLSEGLCRNNVIGDHHQNFTKGIGEFSLSNNVFKGEISNNYFGISFYNNTIINCVGNKIGDFSSNNILEEVRNNNIDSNFKNNVIFSKFHENQISKNFQFNSIFAEKFTKNNIGSNFSKNSIDKNLEFEINSIGEKFQDNEILGNFYSNSISNNFIDNKIYSEFWGNIIRDDFNNNNIYLSSFYDNNIDRFFMSNVLGDMMNILNGEFYYNNCSNCFKNNTIDGSIRENYFTNEFANNIIICDLVNNQFQTTIDSVDMSHFNHINSEYNCRIFKSVDGNLYVEYFDNSRMNYNIFQTTI
jgi:hypothetical protein